VAYTCPYTHTPSGIDTDKPVSLYRYRLRVGEAKKLVGILMPNEPALKVVAITLER
jgi:hypothetical protein